MTSSARKNRTTAQEDLLTIPEAALVIGCSRQYAWTLVHAEEPLIRARLIGSHTWLIPRAEAENFRDKIRPTLKPGRKAKSA